MPHHRRRGALSTSTITVLDHAEWDRAGRVLARRDPDAYRKFLIAARAICQLHESGEHDTSEIVTRTVQMLQSTDDLAS
jgi:hypothetical protein